MLKLLILLKLASGLGNFSNFSSFSTGGFPKEASHKPSCWKPGGSKSLEPYALDRVTSQRKPTGEFYSPPLATATR